MNRYVVRVDIGAVEVEVEAEDEGAATEQAVEELCPCLGLMTDAVCAGTFWVRFLGELGELAQ